MYYKTAFCEWGIFKIPSNHIYLTIKQKQFPFYLLNSLKYKGIWCRESTAGGFFVLQRLRQNLCIQKLVYIKLVHI